MCIDMITTGQNIRTKMADAGLSAKDIAGACCLANPNAVWRWQKGQTVPALDNLVIIAQACGCRLDDLVAVK